MIKGNFETKQVKIIGQDLSPLQSQKIHNHSPDGFNWGYGGSGPAQLALAILLKFETEEMAKRHYQKFKWDIIANLPRKDFVISVNLVKEWIRQVCEGGEI